MRNSFEMDLDEDEYGEVTLPRGYRSPGRRAMGAANMTTPKVIQQQQQALPSPNSSGDPSGYVDPNGQPVCPPCEACPPCPGQPVPSTRMGTPSSSLIGLVIGLGLLGGVAYYAAKQLSPMGELEEEEDDETAMASLPSRIPRMLAAHNEDVIDAEFVEVDEEG